MTKSGGKAAKPVNLDEELRTATLGFRVKFARTSRGLSMRELADIVGIKYQSLQALENEATKGTKHLNKIAKALDVDIDWLETGEGQRPSRIEQYLKSRTRLPEIRPTKQIHTISVGQYDLALSAGPGSLVEQDPHPMGYMSIDEQALRAYGPTRVESLAIVRVAGDSMRTTLEDGDWVLLDFNQRSVEREGVYAIRVGFEAWVKRLSLNIKRKRVRIVSDNAIIPAQEVAEEDLHILGRVIAIVGRKVA